MKKFLQNRKSRVISSALASLALPFILFISYPFDIFGNNLAESNFGLSSFIGTSIVLFLGLFLILFAVMFLCPKKISDVIRHFAIALAVLALVQGTYLNKTSSVAGDSLATGSIAMIWVVLDIALWVVVAIGFIVLAFFKDKKGIIKIVFTVLPVIVIFTQLVNMLTVSVTKEGVFQSKEERDKTDSSISRVLSDKDLTTVSTSGSIYYFIIDRFDETYAEEGYTLDKDLYSNLDGFTWFQDNIAMYGHTFPAVCYMMTDNIYRGADSLRDEYLTNAYKGDIPLKTLSDNGYTINLYSELYYACNSYLPAYVNNAIAGKYVVNDKFGLSIELTAWGLARCLPYKVRDTILVNTSTYNSYATLEENSNGFNSYTSNNENNYNRTKNAAFTATEDKVFSLIHVGGCHEPEEDLSNPNGEKNRMNSLKNSFAIVNSFINELKKNGTYENSTIIITGDHGAPHGDASPLKKSVLTAMFIKPSGSSGTELKISKAQVSQTNTWPTIMKSVGITDSKYYTMDGYFDVDPNKNQVRTQIWQTYASTLDEYVYQITGEGKTFSNWEVIETKHYDRFLMT